MHLLKSSKCLVDSDEYGILSFSPVSFSLEDMVLEAVVVLATLVDPGNENPSQVSVAQEVAAHR